MTKAKTKYHWDVEVPKDGPLTREQAWAALSGLKTKIDLIGYRTTDDKVPQSEAILSEEIELLRGLQQQYSKLIKELSLDVLDKLATIKPDEEPDEHSKHPRNIREILGNYYGEVSVWERKPGNSKTALALAMLEEEGLDTDDIYNIIRKTMNPDSKYTDVWSCPQCDECNAGHVGDDECRRCIGWGYVFGDKPDISEYDWSEKGRAAINRGEPWTPEQEAEEQARIQAEWDSWDDD